MKRSLLGVTAALALLAGASSGHASTPTRIVFSADRVPSLTGEIYRLAPNGRRVDLSRSPFQDADPAVSPNGRKVAFLSARGGRTSLYEVGISGRGLVRLGLSLPPLSGDDCAPRLAWQPRGATLAVAACGSTKGWLWIVRPGHKPLEVLGGKNGVRGPFWSPDGRLLVAWNSYGTLHAISPAGRTLWTGRAAGFAAAWSRDGLLAVPGHHGTAVYDEAGRLRFHFRLPTESGERLAWSPNGAELAALWSSQTSGVEVRTASGRLVLRKGVAGGDMAWAGNSKLVSGIAACPTCATSSLNVRTGKVSPASQRWLEPLSADRKLAIVTPARKPGFLLGVARPGGGPTTRYASIGGCLSDGVWIPAATSLQFVGRTRSLVYQSWSDCDQPFANLYSVASDGGRTTRLTDVQAQETQPALSPDGSDIAYVWASAVGISCSGCSDGIRIASADGTAIRTLTNPQDCTFDDSPTWSPDGTTILYSEDSCAATGELYTVPADGGAPHDLGLAGDEAAWGPSKIAYQGDSDGIWTANPDGSDPVEVGFGGGHPAWSPTGQLAYLAGSSGTTLVIGTTRTSLPFASVASLAWSPDATRLVVTAEKKGAATADVYTIAPDGTDLVRLTKNYDAAGASWR